MQLEVDCTWNDTQNQAKQIIRFDHKPLSLFAMPEEQILLVQEHLQQLPQMGPKALEQLKEWRSSYPDSLYLGFHLYRSFEFFGYEEEQEQLLKELKKSFPNRLLLQCLLAALHLKANNFKQFLALFQYQEVSKALFPKRKFFHFEEILAFHHLWAVYFELTGNTPQSQKHQKFLFLIVNTYKTLCGAQASLV